MQVLTASLWRDTSCFLLTHNAYYTVKCVPRSRQKAGPISLSQGLCCHSALGGGETIQPLSAATNINIIYLEEWIDGGPRHIKHIFAVLRPAFNCDLYKHDDGCIVCGEQDSFTEDYEVYKSEETLQPPHRAAAAAGISQVFADLHGWGNFPDGGRRQDL